MDKTDAKRTSNMSTIFCLDGMQKARRGIMAEKGKQLVFFLIL